jgi:hypothetical protein
MDGRVASAWRRDAITVASGGPDHLDVFSWGQDRATWHQIWNNGAWAAAESLPGKFSPPPWAITRGIGRLDVFALGDDRAAYQTSWNGSNWSSWQLRGGRLTSPPHAVCGGINPIDVFVVKLTNPFLGQTIELDLSDPRRPRRVSELNVTEAAGTNQEVWVDFDWAGADASAGDFFRPFRSLADGVGAVAAHGVVRIVLGSSAERGALTGGKRLRLSAPIGGVRIGSLS